MQKLKPGDKVSILTFSDFYLQGPFQDLVYPKIKGIPFPFEAAVLRVVGADQYVVEVPNGKTVGSRYFIWQPIP